MGETLMTAFIQNLETGELSIMLEIVEAGYRVQYEYGKTGISPHNQCRSLGFTNMGLANPSRDALRYAIENDLMDGNGNFDASREAKECTTDDFEDK